MYLPYKFRSSTVTGKKQSVSRKKAFAPCISLPLQISSMCVYMMVCAISQLYLCNLKNVKNTHGKVILFKKLQALSAKNNTPLWVLFTLL